MKKHTLIKYAAILSSLSTIYLSTILFGSELLSNIASPLVAFFCGYIIWKTNKNREFYKDNWTIISIMCFAWGIADTAWLIVSDFIRQDPEEMLIFMFLYLLSNILLSISTGLYFVKNIKKWHRVQLFLDVVVTVSAISVLLWQFILIRFDLSEIGHIDVINTLLYMLTDVFALSTIFIMYTSSRVRKVSTTMKLIISGIVLFSLTDLYYIYLYLLEAYIPNSAIDFSFMLALVLFGFAALYETYKPSLVVNVVNKNAPENMGRSNQAILLLIFPGILYMMGNLSIRYLFILLVIVLLHQALSSYVQRVIRNEQLLKKEIQMNEKLEGLVAERTQELRDANKALDELSKLDVLTGLYNRRYFMEELDKIMQDKNSRFSILYMDLDRFKIINDTHGHVMGDKVLVEVSKRLEGLKSANTLLARLGDDEFVMIAKDCDSSEQLTELCERINEILSKPILVDMYAFNLGISIGISRFSIDSEDKEQLMKYADIAMYHAKKEYYNKKYVLYNSSQSDRLERRHEIEILLKNVDFDKEFELYFQPQFRIINNKLIGAEALLRWKSPIKGSISPAEFIPIAEEIGLILKIGSWVMRKSMEHVCYWNRKYNLNLTVGINISPKEIDSLSFIPNIKNLISELDVNPDWIDIEITESHAMNKMSVMEEVLTALSGIGLSVSIDDFGTGYSSLSYIKRFDIDRLKIAKELIDNISQDKNELLIVKAIIMMARGMGLITIAEGVETEEQLELLRMLECDEVQGYIASKPIPAEEFENKYLKG